ncbi:MAG: PhnD/SsuA/transferrin family substrate-binding protein [Rhizobiales bacterium]|nr:PhnD/SsuA/transferrin family substrate-binding protein [Hyphomicrobiales bacterium]
MSGPIANARMYAVTPEAEARWQALLGHVAEDAGVTFTYEAYPAPRPLEKLWSRSDLGAVFMCGYPIALKLADVTPIAAPIPDASWAEGRAVYRSDLIVRAGSPFQTLADTFGGRLGWTVEHSHSGFNALRHHLLKFRTPERPKLYGAVIGNLVTARRVLDEVLAGTIDVGPLDAYWHRLIARERPELVAGIRVIDATALAPVPAFVASGAAPIEHVEALREAFAQAHARSWFAELAEGLCITGFKPVDHQDFATTLAWDREAKAAGYPIPA